MKLQVFFVISNAILNVVHRTAFITLEIDGTRSIGRKCKAKVDRGNVDPSEVKSLNKLACFYYFFVPYRPTVFHT